MVCLHSERDACHVPKYGMFQEAEADWKFTAVRARCMSLPWLWCFYFFHRCIRSQPGKWYGINWITSYSALSEVKISRDSRWIKFTFCSLLVSVRHGVCGHSHLRLVWGFWSCHIVDRDLVIQHSSELELTAFVIAPCSQPVQEIKSWDVNSNKGCLATESDS